MGRGVEDGGGEGDEAGCTEGIGVELDGVFGGGDERGGTFGSQAAEAGKIGGGGAGMVGGRGGLPHVAAPKPKPGKEIFRLGEAAKCDKPDRIAPGGCGRREFGGCGTGRGQICAEIGHAGDGGRSEKYGGGGVVFAETGGDGLGIRAEFGPCDHEYVSTPKSAKRLAKTAGGQQAFAAKGVGGVNADDVQIAAGTAMLEAIIEDKGRYAKCIFRPSCGGHAVGVGQNVCLSDQPPGKLDGFVASGRGIGEEGVAVRNEDAAFRVLAAIATGQNADIFAAVGKHFGNGGHKRGLARAACGDVANADGAGTEMMRSEPAAFVERISDADAEAVEHAKGDEQCARIHKPHSIDHLRTPSKADPVV